jgi:hypothetical protein
VDAEGRTVLFDELSRFQNENSWKPLPESLSCVGSCGWQRKKVGIEGDNVRCRSDDRKFNKHRITRIALEFESHSHGSVFVSEVTESVQRQLNSPWYEAGESSEYFRVEQDGSVFCHDRWADERNGIALLKYVNNSLGCGRF